MQQRRIHSYYPTLSAHPAAGSTHAQSSPARSALARSSVPSVQGSASLGRTSCSSGVASKRMHKRPTSRCRRGIDEDEADAEDIDMTDNEQESEREANSADEAFICDEEQDTTGTEQRARDNSSDESLAAGYDSERELQDYHEAIHAASRRKKRCSQPSQGGDDSDDPETQKKKNGQSSATLSSCTSADAATRGAPFTSTRRRRPSSCRAPTS